MACNGIRQSVCVGHAARLQDRAGLHGDSRFRQRTRGFLGGMLLAMRYERGRSHVKMALRHALLATLALAAFQGPAKAQEQIETAAREALAMCRRVDGLPAAERRPLLEQGLELAERA